MSATDASQQANRAGMDPKRLVVVSYLVFGIIISLFLGHVFELLAARVGLSNGRPIEGLDWKYTDIVGVIATVGLGTWAWMNPKTKALSLDVASELMRVTWPSWYETRVSTVAVVIASLVAAFILFFIDTLSYQ